MAAKGQALKGALATMPRQAPLRGDARRAAQAATQAASQVQPTGRPQMVLHGQGRRDYQAAAQAAQAAGQPLPSQQQFMQRPPQPPQRPQGNLASAVQQFQPGFAQGVGQAIAGQGGPITKPFYFNQPGQSQYNQAMQVGNAVAGYQPQPSQQQGSFMNPAPQLPPRQSIYGYGQMNNVNPYQESLVPLNQAQQGQQPQNQNYNITRVLPDGTVAY